MQTRCAVVSLATLSLVAAGCWRSAEAKLQFENQTTAAHSARWSPGSALLADGTSLRIKLLNVSITEDVDPVTLDNVGVTSNIWVNPECGGDVSSCDVAGMDPSSTHHITQFFDFAQPTEAVNAALNAQHAKIDPGTYRYARITFCRAVGGQNVASSPTLMWKAPGMPGELAFTSGDCGRTSQPFATPMQIEVGDTVQVTLGYDLDEAIVVGAPDRTSRASLEGHVEADGTPHFYRACFDIDPTTRACMDFPDFAPSATKG